MDSMHSAKYQVQTRNLGSREACPRQGHGQNQSSPHPKKEVSCTLRPREYNQQSGEVVKRRGSVSWKHITAALTVNSRARDPDAWEEQSHSWRQAQGKDEKRGCQEKKKMARKKRGMPLAETNKKSGMKMILCNTDVKIMSTSEAELGV
ncbi:hypothetical protein PDE_01319 [Penicillium oxalicum 114-2]|uniref:Uncharacterized protein n=1 Tax=Penicillium oxalicum (strain 114-2 / CGMCC 5302) TaxID=933388 RepID=S8AKP8_PENO1|nr:hypothetical protein PDE_01319 [Penicillium oxalicum 114-2]